MLFVTSFARTVARTTAALWLWNTEVSVGIRYTSGRHGNVWSAGLAFKFHTSPLLYADEKG